MKRKAFYWALVILWMTLIFLFSNQPATDSSELSSGITSKIADMINMIVSDISLNQESLNHTIRKGAHFGVYLILGVLVTNALIGSNKFKHNLILIALLICVLYAISDEVHQLFILGRSGEVKDVLLDSAGGLVGVMISLKQKQERKAKKLI